MKIIRFSSLCIAIILGAAQGALAATFSGVTRHVSVNNIKVYDPRTHQTLAFAILPKFKNVFSEDGKTTYQMSAIHAGQYVRVIYDQHFFGMRHADRIFIMSSNNKKLGRQ